MKEKNKKDMLVVPKWINRAFMPKVDILKFNYKKLFFDIDIGIKLFNRRYTSTDGWILIIGSWLTRRLKNLSMKTC